MSRIFDTLRTVLQGKKGSVEQRLVAGDVPLSYEQARGLARHPDSEVRRQLAGRRDLRPEILYFLADDPSPQVRREIAQNIAAPAQADFHLAADKDPSVRGDLAQKIARLVPGLTSDEQDRLRRMTYETLELLARDQITRVRQILAEALKDVADAPLDVIRQLAHDSELVVATPILQYSPVLTDEDLLEIIQGNPCVGTLSAISRRDKISRVVTDKIARTDDIDAIAVLLSNPSAQIREETLDLLLDRAPDHESWHEPLVRRPQLSARAATRLARFVADNLLQVLEARSDFDAATKAAVAAVVRRRVEETGADMVEFRHGLAGPDREISLENLKGMQLEGKLTETAILDALSANDLVFVQRALAVLAQVSEARVAKIAATQSAKGMVSLVWKAELSMQAAVALQAKLAKIAPDDLLHPRPGSKAFPMVSDEMLWQLDFFASMVGDKTASS